MAFATFAFVWSDGLLQVFRYCPERSPALLAYHLGINLTCWKRFDLVVRSQFIPLNYERDASMFCNQCTLFRSTHAVMYHSHLALKH